MTTIPQLGTYEYSQYLLDQAKSLGVTGAGVDALQTATTGRTGVIPDTVTSPTTYQAPITPQSLAPVTAMPVVSPTTTPAYNVSGLEVPQLTATPQEDKASGLTSQLGGLYNSLVGKADYQAQQDQKFGVNTAQAAIQDLSAQLTGLKNEAAAIPLQLQQGAADRGVTTTQLGRQENSRLRTNAIAALGVSTLLAASQGQLANAQALADKAVAQKYDPILERISAAKSNLDLILNDPMTSLQDKNRALAQQAIQDQKELAVSQQKQNATEVWNIATTAASNGSNFKPSGAYTTLATTLQAISQAATKETALQIAVQTGLLSGSAGSSDTTKVLGSASTGYFTYDTATGVKTPISGASGGGGGGSTGSSLAKGSLSSSDYVAKVLKTLGLDYQTVVSQIEEGRVGVIDNKTGTIGSILPGEYSATKYTYL